jgi:mannosyltransferase
MFLAAFVVGVTLRLWGISNQSLSMDEVLELRNAARGLAAIAQTPDGFPPLYNVLLHGWLDLFPGGLASRWLSVLLGALTLYFAWLLGRRIGGAAVGGWTALLLALSPVHIWYSQEGRAYALYVLLVTASLWSLERALDTDSKHDWLLYVVFSALGMYVHYYFAVVVLVSVILVVSRRRKQGGFARPIVAYVTLAILCLPLLWLLPVDLTYQAVKDSGYRLDFGLGALVYSYLSMITGYTLGPSLRELHTMRTGEALAGFLPWLVIILPPVALLSYHGWRVLGRRAPGWTLVLVATPVALIGTIGLLTNVGYNVRYVVWVAVPLTILLAAGATRWQNRSVAIALGLLLGLSGVALANRHFSDRYRNEDMRAVSNYLVAQPDRAIPIFVLSEYMATPLQYYLGETSKAYALPGSIPESTRVCRIVTMIDSTAALGKPYWLVYSRPFHDDPQGSVRQTMQRRDSLVLARSFAGVLLYRGVRSASESAKPSNATLGPCPP